MKKFPVAAPISAVKYNLAAQIYFLKKKFPFLPPTTIHIVAFAVCHCRDPHQRPRSRSMHHRHSSLGVRAGVGVGVGASKGVVDEQRGGGAMMNKGAGPRRRRGHEWEWARAVGASGNGG